MLSSLPGSEGSAGRGASIAVAARIDEDISVVLHAIKMKALRQDESYMLASGRRSNYFLDMKTVLNDGEVLRKIARLVLDRIPDEASAVGGLAMGSIPISTAVVLLSLESRPTKPLRGFWVRQDEKTHGLGGLMSGDLGAADRVVIVDDVTTSGKSVVRAFDAVKETGATVLKVVAIVDRLEGAKEQLERRGVAFESLFTRKDVLGK